MASRDFKLDGQAMGVHRQMNLAGIAGSAFPYSFIVCAGSTCAVLVTRSVTERRRHLSGMRQESDSVSELSVALTDPAQVCGYADHRQVPGLSVQKMAH